SWPTAMWWRSGSTCDQRSRPVIRASPRSPQHEATGAMSCWGLGAEWEIRKQFRSSGECWRRGLRRQALATSVQGDSRSERGSVLAGEYGMSDAEVLPRHPHALEHDGSV